MCLLEQNLKSLQSLEPHLAERLRSLAARQTPLSQRKGDSVVLGDGVFAENESDPLSQTPWPHVRLAFFFGMGFGLEFRKLFQILQKKVDTEIVVIEPHLEVFLEALRHSDFKEIFRSRRVHWWVGMDQQAAEMELIRFFSIKTRGSYINAVQVFVHPVIARKNETYFRFIEARSNELFKSFNEGVWEF